MRQTIAVPILVLLGIIGTLVLMAASNTFNPLMQFVHSEKITILQTGLCIVFTVAGFTSCYFLLNLLCAYFVPRLVPESKNRGQINKAKMQKKRI